MTRPLTPYDTGDVLEPKVWPTHKDRPHHMDWGKVDFENDESATALTLRAVNVPGDEIFRLEVELQVDAIEVVVEGRQWTPAPRAWQLDGSYGTTAYTLHLYKRMGDLPENATMHDLWRVPQLEPLWDWDFTETNLAQMYYLEGEVDFELPV